MMAALNGQTNTVGQFAAAKRAVLVRLLPGDRCSYAGSRINGFTLPAGFPCELPFLFQPAVFVMPCRGAGEQR